MTKFLFVGERQSPKAAKSDATWENGKACAKTLHEALLAVNIDPQDQSFINLWRLPGLRKPDLRPHTPDSAQETAALFTIRACRNSGLTVVALGSLVSERLRKNGISHLKMVHPAARGKIRKRENYQQHVGSVLRAVVENQHTEEGLREDLNLPRQHTAATSIPDAQRNTAQRSIDSAETSDTGEIN